MSLQWMQERRTIRSFDTSRPVSDELIGTILKAVRQAPTAVGAQMVSVLVIRSQASKDFLMEQARGAGALQKHISEAPVFLLFIIDFYKVDQGMKLTGTRLGVQENVNGLFASLTDAGILLGAATAAAEVLGLGTCCIGGIRNNDLAPLIKHFHLPELTFPVCGLCLGYPDAKGEKTLPKPRLPMPFFAHDEVYHTEIYKDLPAVMKHYDEELSRWNGAPMRWTDYLNSAYQKPRHLHVIQNLKDQGFHF